MAGQKPRAQRKPEPKIIFSSPTPISISVYEKKVYLTIAEHLRLWVVFDEKEAKKLEAFLKQYQKWVKLPLPK